MTTPIVINKIKNQLRKIELDVKQSNYKNNALENDIWHLIKLYRELEYYIKCLNLTSERFELSKKIIQGLIEYILLLPTDNEDTNEDIINELFIPEEEFNTIDKNTIRFLPLIDLIEVLESDIYD